MHFPSNKNGFRFHSKIESFSRVLSNSCYNLFSEELLNCIKRQLTVLADVFIFELMLDYSKFFVGYICYVNIELAGEVVYF